MLKNHQRSRPGNPPGHYSKPMSVSPGPLASNAVTSTPKFSGISVIVPAYRSPGTLHQLVEQVDLHVGPLAETIEIIFVDDGSGDQTWATISELAAKFDWVHGITLLRNYGQHNAILAGLRHAKYDIILTIDDDLQNPPAEVSALAAALTDDIDLVYGIPHAEHQRWWRNIASTVLKAAMAKTLGPDVPKKSSAFRLFRRELVAASDHANDPFVAIDVLLTWATNRTTHVEVNFAERADGVSGYTFGQLVRHTFNMMTGYSSRPLRVVSAVGLMFAMFGFALVIFVGIRYFIGDSDVAGFTFLAATITLFSGVQLLSLGVLGEYLGRIHFRSMGRPPYVIRSKTDFNDEERLELDRG